MRRTLKPVNRNTNRIHHLHRQQKPPSSGSPSAKRSFWLHDDNAILEDIETLSLNVSSSSDEGPRRTISQPWSDSFQRDYKASEKRWHNNELVKRFQNKTHLPNNDHGDDNITDHVYTYYGSRSNNADDPVSDVNHEMTCFTIIDRHEAMNTDSSSDKELYECNYLNEYENVVNNGSKNNDVAADNDKSYEEITTVVEPCNDAETRTIWIYSFKNRQSLFNDEQELVNMTSRSSSSSCLQDIPEERPCSGGSSKKMGSTRVPTPIPPNLVPRLDLHLSTLPTVTEISESQFLNEDRSQKAPQKLIKEARHSGNSWVSKGDVSNPKKMEKDTMLCASQQPELLEFSVEESIENISHKLQGTKRSISSQTEYALIVPLIQEAERNRSKDSYISENDVKISQNQQIMTIFSTNEMEYLDQGNIHSTTVDVSSTPKEETDIVHNKTWIEEEKSDEKHATYTKEYEEYSNSAGHRLMVRNTALLKPGRWADFYPADSVPSLQLSLGETDFGDADLPWWRKALKFILCAKCR